MNRMCLLLAALAGGCRAGSGAWSVAGSAFVESERPEGKVVAKVEVRYEPAGAPRPEGPTYGPPAAAAAAREDTTPRTVPPRARAPDPPEVGSGTSPWVDLEQEAERAALARLRRFVPPGGGPGRPAGE